MRVLRRREREAASRAGPVTETIEAAVRELRESGVSRGRGAGAARPAADHARLHRPPDRGQAAHDAHQARPHRRGAARARPRVARRPRRSARRTRSLREELVSLWQTEETRAYRPDVMDEVRNGLYYFETTLYDLAPEVGGLARARGRRASTPAHGVRARLPALRQLDRRRPRRQPLRDRGRDRGGAARAPRARAAPAAARASSGCTATSAPPSGSASTRRSARACERDARARSRTRRGAPRSATAASPTARSCATSTGSSARRSRRARARGGPTTAPRPGAYARRGRAARRPAPAAGEPARAPRRSGWPRAGSATLVRQAEIFGFHLASLDLRQHAATATRARSRRCSAATGSPPATPAERGRARASCSTARDPGRPAVRPAPARLQPRDTNETLDLFRLVRRAHERVGPAAVESYVVSMTRGPSDLLAVLLMARDAGVADGLDVVPLFETVADLHAAPGDDASGSSRTRPTPATSPRAAARRR